MKMARIGATEDDQQCSKIPEIEREIGITHKQGRRKSSEDTRNCSANERDTINTIQNRKKNKERNKKIA